MGCITETSGNIKLRLPKSLHETLIRQAEREDVSLNQLCVMYLSEGIARSRIYIGSENFNRRLEEIYLNSRSDEEMFKGLDKLNNDVEMLKPYLLQELKDAIDNNKRLTDKYIESLRDIYPIYPGKILNQKLPMLKIPSAKLSLIPRPNSYLDFKEIEKLAMEVSENVDVAYGDYDYFIPMQRRLMGEQRIHHISINVYCEYADLKKNILDIRENLLNSIGSDKMDIVIKPCYFDISTKELLEKEYDIKLPD